MSSLDKVSIKGPAAALLLIVASTWLSTVNGQTLPGTQVEGNEYYYVCTIILTSVNLKQLMI